MAFAFGRAEPRAEFLHRSPSGPISIEVSPFDWPQHPRRCWRLVGRWKDGSEFLVMLAVTELDALERLEPALEHLTFDELQQVECVWLERWSPGSRYEYPQWERIRQVSLRNLRFKKALRARRRFRLKFLPTNPKLKGLAS